MNKKAILAYILILSGFIIAALTISLGVRWSENHTVDNNRQAGTMPVAFGLLWLGLLQFSVWPGLRLYAKNITTYMGPVGLTMSSYLKDTIGPENARKLKNTIGFIAFGSFVLIIALSFFGIRAYEDHQLKQYGINQNAVVEKVVYNVKKRPYIRVPYQYKGKHYVKDFANDSIKAHDTVIIRFSGAIPYIAELATK